MKILHPNQPYCNDCDDDYELRPVSGFRKMMMIKLYVQRDVQIDITKLKWKY